MTWMPEAVRQWMSSATDPWRACERADWFIYVSHHHGYPARHLVQALARNMPPFQGPPELGQMIGPLRELIAECSVGNELSPALEEQIRSSVRPQLIDWNVARQSHGMSTPDGIPRRASTSEEPVRAWANAALRLRKALGADATNDESWADLVLVAQYIVFERAGSGRSPLYNHVNAQARSPREVETHRHLCDSLRAELSALGDA